MRRLRGAKLLASNIALIDIHAESRRVRNNVAAAIKGYLDRKYVCSIKPKLLYGRASTFEPGEIRYGCSKMDASRSTNRPKRVVRHEIHVVGLAPAGNFHSLCEAADVANVNP